ncbi:hypothetical protein HYT18_05165 [Candidatus Microgenomates bacterium]|nr:hypothetical protein [Candidatus Microgenomates bacterium]
MMNLLLKKFIQIFTIRFDIPLNLPSRHSFKENTQKRLDLVARNISCNFDAPFCMRNFFWVKDVPFNAIMVKNLKLLAELVAELSLEDDAKFFKGEAEKVAETMKKYMLDKGIFWSTYGENYKKIEVKTWAIFAPLFAEILNQSEAKKLVEKHLLNPKEFWTNYPVPTVSI